MNTDQILDICYLSDTMPDLPIRCIPRDNYLDSMVENLKTKDVFFLDAEEGMGVTTTLAMFAKCHSYNCISYFNSGLVKQLLEPSFIEQSLIKQLYFFIDKSVQLTDEEAGSLSLQALYVNLRRKIRQTGETLYFVFDGFDNVPSSARDNIKKVMDELPWDKGKFIFSGKYENIKDFLPKKIKCHPDQTLQKFSRYEVISFLKEVQNDLSPEDYESLYRISGSVGYQLQAMLLQYDKHHSFAPILQMDDDQVRDLFAYNFRGVEESANQDFAQKVLAAVAFIGMRLQKKELCYLLSMTPDDLDAALVTCVDYLVLREDYVVFNTECNHRYIRNRLAKLRSEIELLFYQKFKNVHDNPEVYSYMPVLLKSMNNKKGLIEYLNSEVVLKNLERQQSQAALNEQCELGYSSISLADLSQTPNYFRISLNKSTSREIELNELWDNQIDALLAVGFYEKALGLALTVYLKEERLKALLLIVRKKDSIPSPLMDEVRSNISLLVKEIDFKHIPDKSMELAKLMFPYDYRIAVDIIEQVAEVSKNRLPIDKLYSLLSMYSGQERDNENGDKFDILSSKIENDELKQMTRAARSIFNKNNVDEIFDELQDLPSIQQGLYLLQLWIPEHIKVNGIGKLVIYAVQAVIALSNIERPKVTLISDFCTALPKMSPSEIEQVVVMLDSFQSSLLTPSEEYVRLELKVVAALFTFNSERACERIQNLYLKIDDFLNKSTAIACKSIILGKYRSLGHEEDIKKALMPENELQEEIEKEIAELFSNTAYHLKIVEEPIRSLVVNYHKSIDTIISGINTQERRSRAYLIAAEAYIRKVKPIEWDWSFLTYLISKIDYEKDDLSQVIYALTNEMVHSKDLNSDFLQNIKRYHHLFYDVEHAYAKGSVLSNLYVIFKQLTPDDSFITSISNNLTSCWEKIDLRWVKVDLGFLIAKTIAKVSIDEAKMWIDKVTVIQNASIMASSSSLSAFQESMDLYTKSLGLLIRTDLVDDNALEEFARILDEFESDGEEIISWSKIALYYYLKDKKKKFDEIYTNHVAKSLDNYSDYYKKYILYHATPAFFIGGKSFFYSLLSSLDLQFQDLCISRAAKFIFVKYVEINDAGPYRGGYELDHDDFDNLLDLLEHCVADNTFFGIFDCVCQSLLKSKKSVSLDQKQHFVNRLRTLVDSALPMAMGIKHDGYKIACQISLSILSNTNQNQSLFNEWDEKISGIDNITDQAFLYIHAAHYIQRTESRQRFISKASNLIKLIPSTFDQSSRLDYCIDECRETTQGLARDMVLLFIDVMCEEKDGGLSDVKRAYDCIYDYDPCLAELFLERVDSDPARLYYKGLLTRYSERTKRIASAKEERTNVKKLRNKEQKVYFSKELVNQINNKAAIYDIGATMDILPIIYDNPISEVRDAIGSFMENVYRKHILSKNQGNLILGLHSAILFNLKLVLALSSGTQDKLNRISQTIGEANQASSPSFIPAGERNKAVKYIVDWYNSHPYDNLFIVDAYFSPCDFYLIKNLMNINSSLTVTVITHRSNVSDLIEYQSGWEKVSSDLTGRINVHTICYENNPSSGPLHARWWLCVNDDDDRRVGIKLTSISGLGNKDEDIAPIEDEKIADIERLATSYALGKRKRVDNNVLKYESIEIKNGHQYSVDPESERGCSRLHNHNIG